MLLLVSRPNFNLESACFLVLTFARFVELGINDTAHCGRAKDFLEDVNMGNCLNYLNVTVGQGRDDRGMERFFALTPEDHVRGFHKE